MGFPVLSRCSEARFPSPGAVLGADRALPCAFGGGLLARTLEGLAFQCQGLCLCYRSNILTCGKRRSVSPGAETVPLAPVNAPRNKKLSDVVNLRNMFVDFSVQWHCRNPKNRCLEIILFGSYHLATFLLNITMLRI